MPVKRRASKRKTHTVTAEAWDLLFECGRDYFGDLDALGLAEAEMIEAAREAWAEHGADFMRGWTPTAVLSVPWAMEVYGPPED